MVIITDEQLVVQNIDKQITAAGASRHSVAQATGIPYQTFLRHMKGNEPGFGVSLLARIAAHLGLDSTAVFYQKDAA